MQSLNQYYWYLDSNLAPTQELIGENLEADAQRLSAGNFFVSLTNAHHAKTVKLTERANALPKAAPIPPFTLPSIKPSKLRYLVENYCVMNPNLNTRADNLNYQALADHIESIYRREVTEMLRRDVNLSFESLAPMTFDC